MMTNLSVRNFNVFNCKYSKFINFMLNSKFNLFKVDIVYVNSGKSAYFNNCLISNTTANSKNIDRFYSLLSGLVKILKTIFIGNQCQNLIISGFDIKRISFSYVILKNNDGIKVYLK